jgi:hypothetical protein
MEKPWDLLPSIWQDWEHQVCGAFSTTRRSRGRTPRIVRHCAYAFLMAKYEVRTPSKVLKLAPPDVRRRLSRVMAEIASSYPLAADPIIYANDALKWTPAQFRDLDRRLEYEYQQAQLARQVEGVETPQQELIET